MVDYMYKSRVIIYFVLFGLLSLGTCKIIDICVNQKDKYTRLYNVTVNRVFEGMSAPRGRMLDVNGVVLVDNIGVNTIMYNKVPGVSVKDEIDTSLALAKLLDISDNWISDYRLKFFYLVLHNNCKDLITDYEYKLLKERKLSSSDIISLKYARITNDMLDSMSDIEKKASYIYYALSKGYSYQTKTIIKGVSDEIIAKVASLNLKGITTTLPGSALIHLAIL